MQVCLFLLFFLFSCIAGAADAVKPGVGRRLESIAVRDGRTFEGLIESESDSWVNLTQIVRPAGKPMYVLIRPIDRKNIVSISRLDAAARAKVAEEIHQFLHRARIEAGRMEDVALEQTRRDGRAFQSYRGRWFALDTTTDEQTARRMIVRLEQAFTAFRQLLTPRVASPRLPRVVIFGSNEEYRSFMTARGISIRNPACFLPKENLLAAGCELDLYRAEIGHVLAAHDQVRRELEELEKAMTARLLEYGVHLQQSGVPKPEASKLLNGEKAKFQKTIVEKQSQLQLFERQNNVAFERAAGQMFVRLYHEGFHAYLETHVFPGATHDVPVWLNEGLAMVVEEGILESGALRIDAPNRPALRRLKRDLAGDSLLRLADVLAADQRQFVVTDNNGGGNSARYYSTAWGLAWDLFFQHEPLSDEKLNAYVRPAEKNGAAKSRFETLVDEPLDRFEKNWRARILSLR